MPKARKVATPGSAPPPPPAGGVKKAKSRRRAGRPAKAQKRNRVGIQHRAGYSEDDMMEAVRLVTVENMSIKKAAALINSNKLNEVPRMTLSNRLNRAAP